MILSFAQYFNPWKASSPHFFIKMPKNLHKFINPAVTSIRQETSNPETDS
jgi:hypothetical protein